MPKILFIDDDIFPKVTQPDGNPIRVMGDYMWYYQEALRDEPGYEVFAVSKVDEAIDAIRSIRPELVVLDIMMEPGQLLGKSEDVRGGLCTGLVLAKRIQVDFPEIPIVLLSNAVAPEAPQQDMAGDLKLNEIVREVFYKPKTTPFCFLDAVKEILEES